MGGADVSWSLNERNIVGGGGGTRCRTAGLRLSGMRGSGRPRSSAPETGTEAQSGTNHEPLGDDPDALRRRIQELELGEHVDAGGSSEPQKDPDADLRRQFGPGEDDADRPPEAEVCLCSMFWTPTYVDNGYAGLMDR